MSFKCVAGFVILVFAVLAAGVYSGEVPAGTDQALQDSVSLPEPSPPVISRSVIQPYLDQAETDCQKALNRHLGELRRFFQTGKRGTRKFAESALSWNSKWRLVKDQLPFQDGGHHNQFIRQEFDRHVFDPSAFEKVLKRTVENYNHDVESIENVMLVKIRADIENLPEFQAALGNVKAVYLNGIQRMIENGIAASIQDGKDEIKLFVVSMLIEEVVKQVVVSLSVSTGIMGTGAIFAPETFGASLVIGLVIDLAITSIMEWWIDPEADLAAKLNEKIDEIERNTVQATAASLQDLAKRRAACRNRIVFEALNIR